MKVVTFNAVFRFSLSLSATIRWLSETRGGADNVSLLVELGVRFFFVSVAIQISVGFLGSVHLFAIRIGVGENGGKFLWGGKKKEGGKK